MRLSYNYIWNFVKWVFASSQEVKDKLNQMWLEVESTKIAPDGDSIFDMEITPNRPDLLSYVGVLRDILATTDSNIDILSKVSIKNYDLPMASMNNNLKNPKLCPAFYARKIKWIKMVSTPVWMRTLLEKHEINTVNVLVDITNYVMLELWQPMHAYDTDTLQWNICVWDGKAWMEVVCLDGATRKLTWDEVIIYDEAGNFLWIWWVMWWENSKISETTKNITLESAYFDPVSIRYTSRKLRTSTDASYRYERWADPVMMKKILDRATDLVLEYCGWEVESDYGYNNIDYKPRDITIELDYVSRLIWVKLEKDFIINTLKKFGFEILSESAETICVRVPSFRYHDIKFDTCLVEEIWKVYWFDNIPIQMPRWELLLAQKSKELSILDDIEKFFIKNWFNEVINFAFLSPKCYNWFELEKSSSLFNFVEIEAPLWEDFSVMRTSLVPWLLKNFDYNINRWEENFKFFEIGRIFTPAWESKKPIETKIIAWLISGKNMTDNWKHKYPQLDLYDVKSIIYWLFEDIWIDMNEISVVACTSELVEPAQAMDVLYKWERIWYVGLLKVWAFINKKQKNPAYVFEFNYDKFVGLISTRPYAKFEEFSLFPSSFKDVDFVCDKNFESKKIIDEIYTIWGKLVKSVELFDVYEGKWVPEWKVSMTFNMEFQHKERSLTWEEVIEIFNKVIASVTSKYEVKLRD